MSCFSRREKAHSLSHPETQCCYQGLQRGKPTGLLCPFLIRKTGEQVPSVCFSRKKRVYLRTSWKNFFIKIPFSSQLGKSRPSGVHATCFLHWQPCSGVPLSLLLRQVSGQAAATSSKTVLFLRFNIFLFHFFIMGWCKLEW